MNASGVTTYFLVMMTAILLAGLCLRIIEKRTSKLLALMPNIAVSLGILGTFIGIYIGLLEFDVGKISESIPKLLEGLKTAFVTSIVGIIVSIILKFFYELKSSKEESKNEVKLDDPIELLKNIALGINNLDKSSKEIEKSILSCFKSDEEYSLISQLKLIRQEISDTRRETNESFKNFAKEIAKSNTDALVKALENVISDFNVLLNELVSDSFKELSFAMVKLTEWQNNYKVHIDETGSRINTLLSQLSESAEILKISSDQISQINLNLESIDSTISGLSVSAEDISLHIEHLKNQNATLNEIIMAVRDIGSEAKNVIPSITKNIESLTSKLDNVVSTTVSNLEANNKEIGNFVESSIKNIQLASNDHTEFIKKSIENIDKALEDELSKALNSLAGSMAALSAKFVEDYKPLTERLREIVRLAEKIDAK